MATTTTPTFGYDDLPELLTRLTGDEKHDWSSLSTLDVLWVLHDRVLGPDDRFLLSKGHGPAAFYAVLAAKGLIPVDALEGWGAARCDGRDHASIEQAFAAATGERPHVVVAEVERKR